MEELERSRTEAAASTLAAGGLVVKCKKCGRELRVPDEGSDYNTLPLSPGMAFTLRRLARHLTCDACIAEHDKQRRREQMQAQARELVSRGVLLDGFGRHRLADSLEAFERHNPDAWALVRSWKPSDLRSWFVWGEPDSGKTHLCRTLVQLAFRSGLSCMECMGCDFGGKFGQFRGPGLALFEHAKRVQVLYCQDVDKGRWNEESLSRLHELMTARHARGAMTVWCSNIGPEKLDEHWSECCPKNASVVQAVMTRMHPMVPPVMMSAPDGGMRRMAGEIVSR